MSLCRSNRINMSDLGTSSRGTRQRSRVQEATKGDNKDSSGGRDMFMQKLKMAAENKMGLPFDVYGSSITTGYCHNYLCLTIYLVHRELNLDAAKKFLSAYES
ncbi:hypothetical protein ZEAMMB73_Zm00001d022308 [Zea mays]|uniref:Uncharacterized protein n=1 Tax=Zea mays TaxID=4577 RepID=A0A1D6IL04_MAIZE|nr:hypothetical protein ZEAMMB73_Zm00001d022308 [Zea mays]ONM60086.1 hypothetical protein ZEAMMB73_Zm00001d022308 [Zea mays]